MVLPYLFKHQTGNAWVAKKNTQTHWSHQHTYKRHTHPANSQPAKCTRVWTRFSLHFIHKFPAARGGPSSFVVLAKIIPTCVVGALCRGTKTQGKACFSWKKKIFSSDDKIGLVCAISVSDTVGCNCLNYLLFLYPLFDWHDHLVWKFSLLLLDYCLVLILKILIRFWLVE